MHFSKRPFQFQCLVKLFHIRYIDDLQGTIRSIQNLYKIHSKTKSIERIEYFEKFAFVTEVLFKGMTIVYISSTFTFYFYPVYMYLYENEIVPIIPLYLPAIDENQFTGYVILCVIHVTVLNLATFGVLACDFFIAIIIISTLIFAKLISLDFEQIDMDLMKNASPLRITGRFRNILLMHQEMFRLVEGCLYWDSDI